MKFHPQDPRGEVASRFLGSTT